MGGSMDYHKTTETDLTSRQAREKYAELVRERQWDYGHGGYSGTFAEKPELTVRAGDWTERDAEQDAADNNDKWGPTFAYRLDTGAWYFTGWCSS